MRTPRSKSQSYRDVLKKIGEHGAEEVEAIIDVHGVGQKEIQASRVLIVLEALYHKAINGNLGAAQQYLDRILGKPKESLSITNDSEGIGKLSDGELIGRAFELITQSIPETELIAALKAATKRGDRAADK